MANDYVPFSSASFPTRPASMGTGYDIGVQDLIMRLAQQKQLDAMDMIQRQRIAENQRYEGMTPNELEKSNLEGANARARNNPSFIETMMSGEKGKAQSEAAKGSYDQQMLPSKVATDTSTNKLTQAQNSLKFMDTHWDNINAAEKSGVPGAAQAAYTAMREAIPEEHRGKLPETYSPQVAAHLQKLRENLVNSVAQQQKIAEIGATGAWHKDVARITGEYGLQREREKTKAKNISDMRVLLLKKDPVDKYLTARQIAMDGDQTFENRKKAEELANEAYPAAQEKLRKANMEIGADGQIRQVARPNLKPGGGPNTATGTINGGPGQSGLPSWAQRVD